MFKDPIILIASQTQKLQWSLHKHVKNHQGMQLCIMKGLHGRLIDNARAI